jgi:peptide/nickel transport system ATP-binding protein
LLFISHDLDIVELLCERVAVLYLGRIMETGPTVQVMKTPRHPYSRALLAAVPKADPEAPRVKRLVAGDIPSPLTPPSGCVFRTRCFYAENPCASDRPVLAPLDAGWQSACLRDPLPEHE